MVGKPPSPPGAISEKFVDEVCARLAEHKRVRRTLPGRGRLHVDRQLPFLCVYRRPTDRKDAGTDRLVTGEASFLIAPGGTSYRKGLWLLVRRLIETMTARFGAFLIVEVWSALDRWATPVAIADPSASSGVVSFRGRSALVDTVAGAPIELKPAFGIATRGPNTSQATVDALAKALRRIKIHKHLAEVEINGHTFGRPLRMPLLISQPEMEQFRCRIVGLEVRPVYRDSDSGEVFPSTLRVLRRGLSRALKQAFYTFAWKHTSVRPEHYYALGRRAMVKAVWEVDRRLAEISDAFDFLLQVTPVNAEAGWRRFQRDLFQTTPVFLYRPLAVEPTLLKRRLFEIPIDRIEDPTLAHLFRQRQDELDRKITMLADVGTPRFLLGSLQVYGPVEQSLLRLANELLAAIPPRARDASSGKQLDAREFADRARAEIEHYRRSYPEFRASVTIRDDMYWGLLCSGGDLLVGRQTKIPAGRVNALLQHEVGTHLVTYYNGRAQPFRQLYTGLAGYDALQEGLAVLSEHLVGGLSRPRLRLLAARVLAAHQLVEGASFLDTFRFLCRTHGFPQRTAYTVTVRAYRGGGLTKDVVYLRGLVEILDYLRGGGELETLLIGKIAADHIPLVRELQLRQVLRPPPLRARFLDDPQVSDKLARLRSGVSVQQLIQGRVR